MQICAEKRGDVRHAREGTCTHRQDLKAGSWFWCNLNYFKKEGQR